MVAPLVPAMIMGGASLASGVMGAMGAAEQNRNNFTLGMMQLQQQQKAFKQAQEAARRSEELATANRTNARGDVAGFSEGRGFFVDPSQTTQDIIGLEDANTLEQMMRALQLNQEQFDVAEGRGQDRLDADTARGAFQREQSRPTEQRRSAIEGALAQRAKVGLDRGFDDQSAAAYTTLQRQLGANPGGFHEQFGEVSADMAERRGEANAAAESDAYLKSLGITDQLQTSGVQRTGNVLNQLMARANNVNNVPVTPFNVDNNLTNVQDNIASGAAGGAAAGIAAAQTPTGQAPQFKSSLPSLGLAIGSGGSALAAMLERMSRGENSGDKIETARGVGLDYQMDQV